MAKISIVIPYHSNPQWLYEAVASTLNQDSCEAGSLVSEVLVIDDSGSSQNLGDELGKRFGARAPRYLKNDSNLGIGQTWNKALELATGSLVCLLHADDRLMPQFCAEIWCLHQRHPQAAAYFTGADVINKAGRSIASLPEIFKELRIPYHDGDLVLKGERALAQLCRVQFVICPTLVYHRALLGPGPHFRQDLKQVLDFDFLARLFFEGHQLAGRPYKKLYQFRRSGLSQTDRNSKDMSRYDEEKQVMIEVAQRAQSMGWHEVEREARSQRLVKLHAIYRAVKSFSLRPLAALFARE